MQIQALGHTNKWTKNPKPKGHGREEIKVSKG